MPKRYAGSHARPQPPRRTEIAKAIALDLEADVLPGLERFVIAELREHLQDYIKIGQASDDGAIRFSYTGALHSLLTLRSVVAVYLVRRFSVPRPRGLLGHEHFNALLGQIAAVRAQAPQGAFQTLRLSAAGEDSAIISRLKHELSEQTGLALAVDEGDLLLRLRRSADGAGWEVLVRISPRPLATRPWRVCNRPGALNATLAHAMMRLSAPQADDRILNLACGSGTLLVERLAIGPAGMTVGCDTDPAALECARANLQAAGLGDLARLEQWDASALPLSDSSATMLCADLPFGQLIGSHRENQALYPRLFAEAARVATPGARMVLLTHEIRLLEQVARQHAGVWREEQMLRVRSGGMTPGIYLFRRI